ncbi:hypothetical protein glysoja_039774 [Glycine soja]|uniref:Uncharacterized protein n=1 Tax=Glycine soja TaxID=3848 RepID=A0A0B2QVW0_GLYSO|nr:hypothetical protein glysoja_039774 [Glycine soja]
MDQHTSQKGTKSNTGTWFVANEQQKLQSNHNAVIIPSSLPKVMNHVRKKDPST